MSNAKVKKLQYLLINQLMREGSVKLLLPDHITLEIGITQEGQNGQTKADDYCYVVAKKDDKTAMIDSYNLSLQFQNESDIIVCEDEAMDEDGHHIYRMEVV